MSLPFQRALVERLSLKRPAAGSPRIAVIGNCQASAIARAIRLLRPGADVRYLSAGTIGRRRIRPDQLVMDMAGYDYVFAQCIRSGHLGPEHYAALAEDRARFRAVPAIVFAAFHPDLVYVGGPGTAHPAFLDSPVGHYHSAITLYAFLAGFSVEQTLRLFMRETFAYLGYLDLWRYSQETLLQIGREAGMDLAPHLLLWARRGCFMHSVNHPKMAVAADLARIVLESAGIAFADYDLDGFLIDDLSLKGMWPVYEPIAQHYGVPGSTMFRPQATRRRRAPERVLTLPEFVAESFAIYARADRRALVSDRVQSWLATEPVNVTLRALAG